MGLSGQLIATVTPKDATAKSIEWSVMLPAGRSKNETAAEDIATASDNGLVVAISAGGVIVTATTTDGGLTASVEIIATNVLVANIF